jgi:hypothetical protein
MHNSTIEPSTVAFVRREEQTPSDPLELRVSLPSQAMYQSGLKHPELRINYDTTPGTVSLESAETYATNDPLEFSITGHFTVLAALSKTDTNGACVYFDPFGRSDESYTALQVASSHPLQIGSSKSIIDRIGHVTKPIVRYVANGMPNANKLDTYFSGGRATSGMFGDLYNK